MKRAIAPRRRYGVVIASTIVLFLAILLIRTEVHSPASTELQDGQTVQLSLSNGQAFSVKVAAADQSREKGLSDTDQPPEQGMLFAFSAPEEACFWMKDMRYPLDILWFNARKQLVYQQLQLSPDTYPQKYCPPESAQYVLEVKAGSFATKKLDKNTLLYIK